VTFCRPWGLASVCAAGLFLTACAGGSAATTQDAATIPAEAEPAAITTTAPVTSPDAPAAGTDTPASDPAESDRTAAPPIEPAAEAAPAPTEAEPVAETAVAVDLPTVEVVDLATGEPAALTSFTRPGVTLVWFWAPH